MSSIKQRIGGKEQSEDTEQSHFDHRNMRYKLYKFFNV